MLQIVQKIGRQIYNQINEISPSGKNLYFSACFSLAFLLIILKQSFDLNNIALISVPLFKSMSNYLGWVHLDGYRIQKKEHRSKKA